MIEVNIDPEFYVPDGLTGKFQDIVNVAGEFQDIVLVTGDFQFSRSYGMFLNCFCSKFIPFFCAALT